MLLNFFEYYLNFRILFMYRKIIGFVRNLVLLYENLVKELGFIIFLDNVKSFIIYEIKSI